MGLTEWVILWMISFLLLTSCAVTTKTDEANRINAKDLPFLRILVRSGQFELHPQQGPISGVKGLHF